MPSPCQPKAKSLQPLCQKPLFPSYTRHPPHPPRRDTQDYFGIDGKLSICKEFGYASAEISYDNKGNRIKQAYFGVDGKPCLLKDGFASMEMVYNNKGNCIKEAYFGIDGKPCLLKNGFASMEMVYNNKGNPVNIAFFDTDGLPCFSNNCDFASVKLTYDQHDRLIHRYAYGLKGEPLYREDYTYDRQGNRVDTKRLIHKKNGRKR